MLGSAAVAIAGMGSYFAAREDVPKEVLSAKRVKYYPYLAGISLMSINLFMEFFGPSTVNRCLVLYFGLAGTNSIWFVLRNFIRLRGPKLFMFPRSRTVITEFVLPQKSVPFHVWDIPMYAIGLLVNVLYFTVRGNLLNNIVAGSIAFFAVMSIRIEKFTSAGPFLWSLLIYDAFFVYSTDVMTSVARNLDGPVKLLYRKRYGVSVLGLGDVVIPGLFVSICSRFDAFLFRVLRKRSPYWVVSISGYALGLILTDIVCAITHSGQPALIFIVPSITIPIIVLALIRKEYRAFLGFSG